MPDYYLGRLIYHDGPRNIRWAVYDGRERRFFRTEEEAKRWCEQQANTLSVDDMDDLMRAQYRAQSVADFLHTMAGNVGRLAPELELLSVAQRRIADHIDTLISQQIRNEERKNDSEGLTCKATVY